MADVDYYKDGVARVLDLLKDTFQGQFKQYFNGEAEGIPESMLPCIMVSETQGQIQTDTSATDQISETIKITVALNKRDDLGAPADQDLTEFKLRKLVKGQDPATGQYLPGTIMYAIRKHITMNGGVLSSNITTNFDVNVRGEDTVTQEATIMVVLQRLAFVPSRD